MTVRLLIAMKNEKEEWRRLCELVANEPNPQKLSEYLDQLIRALDARKQRLDAELEAASGPNHHPHNEEN